MLKELISVWKRGGLMQQANAEALLMVDLTKEMYIKSIETLESGSETCSAELYKVDKKVNELQMSVRRKVLEHLSISPSQDVTAALILILVVNDFERIGDYCKNVCDLAGMRAAPLKEGKYQETVREADDRIRRNFDRLKEAFSTGATEKADRVLQNYTQTKKLTEGMIAELLKDTKLKGSELVTLALLARHLKRLGAHQKNAATALVNPFEKIGYLKGKGKK